MKKVIHTVFSFLEYWFKKEDRYSLQSSFIFSLYNSLNNHLKTSKQLNCEVEEFRKELLKNHNLIEVNDLGAGSKRVNRKVRKISQIAKFSTSPTKYAGIYQYFCQLTPADQVLELGTGLGITTRYLSKVTKGQLRSVEGSEKIWEIAQTDPKPKNAEFIWGNIEEALPLILSSVTHLDFVLIDANHTLEGTLFSFNRCLPHLHKKSILIVGDIHWSREMELSWKEIKNHPEVKLTLDFFECGVVFFEYSGSKTHLVLDI